MSEAAAGQRRVLVVEDEDNIALALEFIVTRAGYGHARIASGARALDTIRTSRPDLVLLDVMLPERSGYEICRDLRSDPAMAGVKVLMMTARGSSLERQRGMELGADGFISKPFDPKVLQAEMTRLLSAPH